MEGMEAWRMEGPNGRCGMEWNGRNNGKVWRQRQPLQTAQIDLGFRVHLHVVDGDDVASLQDGQPQSSIGNQVSRCGHGVPDPVLPWFAPLVSGCRRVPVVRGISVFRTRRNRQCSQPALIDTERRCCGGLEQTFDCIGELCAWTGLRPMMRLIGQPDAGGFRSIPGRTAGTS